MHSAVRPIVASIAATLLLAPTTAAMQVSFTAKKIALLTPQQVVANAVIRVAPPATKPSTRAK